MVADNRACARRRVTVEHTSGRLRRYDALTRTDRHHRRGHTVRVRAVAGLVNRRSSPSRRALIYVPLAVAARSLSPTAGGTPRGGGA